MPVDEMLSRMTAKELQEWIAFASVEPIGDDREDLRMAMICNATANASGAKKKDGEAPTLSDFLVDFWKDPEPAAPTQASWRRNKEIAIMATIALGGKVGAE